MTLPKSFFPEKGESAGVLKVCGTCKRVRFHLTPEELQLLHAVIKDQGFEALRHCTARDYRRNWKSDASLKAAAELVRTSSLWCRAADAPAAWADKACFLWIP
jgi:hypothetical protein